ncbi:hypothetical protein [Niveispirillum sp.]|uniref:hypothetical protein n=1 Tax=Niveispirillum sp. TaxID=1917217 RepID=UPI0025F5FFB6|nr:hypothetical protein [Niveispirillum sp.]
MNDQSQGDDPEKRFEELWAAYPSRGDNPNPRKPAREKFLKLVKAGTAPDEIIRGALGYAAAMKRKQQAPEYIQQAVTWLNQAGWQQYASPQANAPPHAARRQAAAESVFDLVNTQ